MDVSRIAGPVFVFALTTALIAVGQGPQESKSPPADEKTIRSLIADLGSESFDKRDAAHKRLLKIGGPALELLEGAAKNSADAEARERATQLIEAFQELHLLRFRAEFYHDFRKGLPKGSIRLAGPSADKIIRPEPEGLRIAAGETNKDAIGVAVELSVKGDFEITAGYEIISVGPKQSRRGFELYLMSDTPTKEALAFDRATSRDGQEVYVCSRMTTIDGKRANTYQGNDVPAFGKAGHLRIVRVGTKAILSVQEDGKEPRAVHRVELGKEDLALLRLAANPGGVPNAVDLRLRDIRVRCADADALKPRAAAQAPPRNQ